MSWTPRGKATTFAILLLLVSTAFLVTAAARSNGILAPFAAGDEFPEERPLSRHGVALAVLVGAFAEEGRTRVEGAAVAVYRVTADDPAGGEFVTEATTDDKGRAIFHLQRGGYRVEVSWDGHDAASAPFRLRESQRTGVYFDEDGAAHWIQLAHRDLERRGDVRALLVRVVDTSSGERAPAAGAATVVYGTSGDGERTEVGRATTGPRGAAVFQLHPGSYEVEVSYEGATGSTSVALRGDARVTFVYDGDELVPQSQQDARPARAAHR